MLRVSKSEYLFDPLQRLRSPSVEYNNSPYKRGFIILDKSVINFLPRSLEYWHLKGEGDFNPCSGFYYSPLRGSLAIFSTGTYAGIGKMCVKSETCYEKYHDKKKLSTKVYFSLTLYVSTNVIVH